MDGKVSLQLHSVWNERNKLIIVLAAKSEQKRR